MLLLIRARLTSFLGACSQNLVLPAIWKLTGEPLQGSVLSIYFCCIEYMHCFIKNNTLFIKWHIYMKLLEEFGTLAWCWWLLFCSLSKHGSLSLESMSDCDDWEPVVQNGESRENKWFVRCISGVIAEAGQQDVGLFVLFPPFLAQNIITRLIKLELYLLPFLQILTNLSGVCFFIESILKHYW